MFKLSNPTSWPEDYNTYLPDEFQSYTRGLPTATSRSCVAETMRNQTMLPSRSPSTSIPTNDHNNSEPPMPLPRPVTNTTQERRIDFSDRFGSLYRRAIGSPATGFQYFSVLRALPPLPDFTLSDTIPRTNTNLRDDDADNSILISDPPRPQNRPVTRLYSRLQHSEINEADGKKEAEDDQQAGATTTDSGSDRRRLNRDTDTDDVAGPDEGRASKRQAAA